MQSLVPFPLIAIKNLYLNCEFTTQITGVVSTFSFSGMSSSLGFFQEKNLIEEQEFVIFFISPENLQPVRVTKGQVINNRLGKFLLEKAIGQPFGYVLAQENGGKHKVALLRPTPELWTRCLPHRTQILYVADIALIVQMLKIGPGSVVIESGTGSGSMTHSLARAVGSTGRVCTFEFHPQRAEMAKQEFAKHGLSWVQVEHRDVCSNGFPEGIGADVVFLDLPEPWQVVPMLHKSVRRNRTVRICCFSPCIEQVQKTCEALRQNGFIDVEMYECLLRNVEVVNTSFYEKKRNFDASDKKNLISKYSSDARGHTSYLTFASLPAVATEVGK